MKKRLLSAALALAMVLTLLPMSAFAYDAAASTDNGKTAQYHAKFDSQITDETDPSVVPGWLDRKSVV